MTPAFDIVIPTLGRPELARLLDALDACDGPRPQHLYVVDDRAACDGAPLAANEGWLAARTEVIKTPWSRGPRGPAYARNVGWRRARAPWIVFLDDDVVPPPHWLRRLGLDLERVDCDDRVAGTTGRIAVPLPTDRRATDWERDVAGLQDASWITADIAYRRRVLETLDGFDEGFTLAYREDADFGLRVHAAGFHIVQGTRALDHPVRPADFWISVRRQRGNESDARMRAKHGSRWRARAHVPAGRLPMHILPTASAVAALVRRRPVPIALWLLFTGEFAWRRIAPGPRTAKEIARMVVTSVCIPPAAVWYRLRGEFREHRNPPLDLVLVDRDGTIVVDVPYNGDPSCVEPVADAPHALGRLRARGIKVGVISNQSGIGRGILTHEHVQAVNARIDALLGPFAGWW